MRLGAQQSIVREDLDDLALVDTPGNLGWKPQYYWDREDAVHFRWSLRLIYDPDNTPMCTIYGGITRPSFWRPLFYAYSDPYTLTTLSKYFPTCSCSSCSHSLRPTSTATRLTGPFSLKLLERRNAFHDRHSNCVSASVMLCDWKCELGLSC